MVRRFTRIQLSNEEIQRRLNGENFGGPAIIQCRSGEEYFDFDEENFDVGEVRTSTLAKEDFASDEGRTSSLTKTELRLALRCYDEVNFVLISIWTKAKLRLVYCPRTPQSDAYGNFVHKARSTK